MLGLVLAFTRVAAAQPTEAERFYTEGQKAYDAQRFDEALVAWERAYELSRLPALMFNIAQAYRLNGNCAKAIASYRTFVELAPTSDERGDAEALIREMSPCPAVVVTPPPSKPKPPSERAISPSANPGRGKRIVGGVIAVGGVGLVAVGVVFGSKAAALADEVKAACVVTCDFAMIGTKDADGRAAERNQFIFLGAGGAAIVTGSVLYFLGKRDGASTVAIAPRGDGGAAITWSGSW